MDNKHYITIDENNLVIDAFSNAFRIPADTDICINENAPRHLVINGVTNPTIKDDRGLYAFKYINGEIVEATESDQQSMVDKLNQEKINAESRAYLASTDWYVIRYNETQEPIPKDVLTKRVAARKDIINV